MKTYSLDFRSKLIQVYENEGISQRQLARRFCVALSFIQKLLKQYRETGSIAAKPFAGGVKLKLTSEQLVSLAELIEGNNDATKRRTQSPLPRENRSHPESSNNGKNDPETKDDSKKKHFTPTKKKVTEFSSSGKNSSRRFEIYE